MHYKDEGEAIASVKRVTDASRAAGNTLYAHVLTFGCQQNEADSEKLRGMLRDMGYERAEDPACADVILVNTCAIREHAELKALSVIGSFKKIKEKNSSLIIGVCGCMSAEEHRVDELKRRYPYVTFTLEPAALHKLPEMLLSAIEKKKRQFPLGAPDAVVEGVPVIRSEKHRAWVSIMYGCNNFCSYCIVPYVRGRERSRESREIINEVEALVRSGARDITLLGQNVNSYRSDMDFPALLSALDKIEGEYALRFMTSHPKDASDELIEVLRSAKHIAPHFHLPLQSGSDRILSAMNRHYNRERYLSVVRKLKKAVPHIAITSDVIVGFPGENEEDFEETLSLLREVQFDSVYSFIYSPRRGTPAAKMENAVPKEVQGERFRRLLDLQTEISLEKNRALIGKHLRILADGASKGDKEMMSGRTDAGKLVHFQAPEDTVGRFITVRIDRADPYALYGTYVK